MISVDNFYYILYKKLLEPARFNAAYFYPFGNTQPENLKRQWSTDLKVHYDSYHTVLFYDQEPLLCKELPLSYLPILTSNLFCKILANSEHSQDKKRILKQENFIDWYYFYHGFAALDWYRDFQYLENVEYHFTKVFISLNRLHTNYRSYRLNLINEYIKRDLLDEGHVSFASNNNEYGTWQLELKDPYTLLPSYKLNEIETNLQNLQLPLTLDHYDVKGFASADSSPTAFKLNQSALWHVVGETIFYQNKLHLTEKIFKPITCKRPFILAAAPGNLNYLKSYGFKTFSDWICEDYDMELDHDKRIIMIVDQLQKLCNLSFSQLKNMHKEMQEVLDFNYQHFFGEFKQFITAELFNNFSSCIKIYNNGLSNDYKIIVRQSDLAHLQNLFLR